MSATFLVYEEDAMSGLKHFREHSIDCVYTSPNPPKNDTDIAFLVEYFSSFKKHLSERGVIFVQLGDYHDPFGGLGGVPAKFGLAMKEEGYLWRSITFWHRLLDDSKQEDNMRYKRDVEYVLMFAHDRNHYFNDRLGLQKTSLMSIPYEKTRKTEFRSGHPEELIRRHILPATKPADIVLDPFCGTGTTGVVCLKNGRHFIGFETKIGLKEKIDNRLSKFGIKELEVGDIGLQI